MPNEPDLGPVEGILSQHAAERDAYGEQLMKALRDAMPWGLKVDLGNGQIAELMPMNGRSDASQPYRHPVYPEGEHPPAVGEGPEPIEFGPWRFSFDWRLTNCDQDHIEVTAEVSGGGGI